MLAGGGAPTSRPSGRLPPVLQGFDAAGVPGDEAPLGACTSNQPSCALDSRVKYPTRVPWAALLSPVAAAQAGVDALTRALGRTSEALAVPRDCPLDALAVPLD